MSDVSFKYEDKMVLKNINLRIARNETVALVGESGVGKTTLVNLILRFYDVSEGAITLDGVDIRDISLNTLRENMALVTQDVILFNDTVAKNITHGKEEDLERVEAVIGSAYAADFISKLPKKLDTIVGREGHKAFRGPEAEDRHRPGPL